MIKDIGNKNIELFDAIKRRVLLLQQGNLLPCQKSNKSNKPNKKLTKQPYIC